MSRFAAFGDMFPCLFCAQMSPYASIAFHPLDGIMQACPYVILLFFIPVHFLTSMVMLFFTGIWAMNIHVSYYELGRAAGSMISH